ncbi:hypothetical protein [Streptomyces sp. NPDC050704]|uniref:hypothetical protein n=1 Tax=Streptomyces sp. NPDC050704 TaxID=3157219 RepID=UPI0034438E71
MLTLLAGVTLLHPTAGTAAAAGAGTTLRGEAVWDAAGSKRTGSSGPTRPEAVRRRVDDVSDRAGRGDWLARAVAPYRVSGERVHGADGCEKAPRLKPGSYQDAMAYQQQRWYKVALKPGERLRFSGAVIPRARYDVGVVHLYLHLPGRSRWWAFQASVAAEWSTILSAGVRSERLTADAVPAGADSASVCVQLVSRVRSQQGAHPVELVVGREVPSGRVDVGPTPQAAAPGAEQRGRLLPQAAARPDTRWTWLGALGAGVLVVALCFLMTAVRRAGVSR